MLLVVDTSKGTIRTKPCSTIMPPERTFPNDISGVEELGASAWSKTWHFVLTFRASS